MNPSDEEAGTPSDGTGTFQDGRLEGGAEKVEKEEKESFSSSDPLQAFCTFTPLHGSPSSLHSDTFPSLRLLCFHFFLQDRRAGRGCVRGRETRSERRPVEPRGVGGMSGGSRRGSRNTHTLTHTQQVNGGRSELPVCVCVCAPVPVLPVCFCFSSLNIQKVAADRS